MDAPTAAVMARSTPEYLGMLRQQQRTGATLHKLWMSRQRRTARPPVGRTNPPHLRADARSTARMIDAYHAATPSHGVQVRTNTGRITGVR
jgi:hypothetical protein